LVLLVRDGAYVLTATQVKTIIDFPTQTGDADVHEGDAKSGLHFTALDALIEQLLTIPTGAASIPSASGDGWRNEDPELRVRVERKSVELVVAHYRKQGFAVESVEKESLGWDLNVIKNGRLWFRVEVKGRGGRGDVELTPNEYAAMRDEAIRVSYRLAVVRDALSRAPTLTVFSYGADGWRSADGTILNLTEKLGVVCHF
jgi:hypothetical protein